MTNVPQTHQEHVYRVQGGKNSFNEVVYDTVDESKYIAFVIVFT